ncbi:phosphatidylinositol 3,4,5-trisphosphate 3-phosphatase and dual-specificity protein phosphatase PTEN-like [Oppia nitens]|uniref:phosphatidylinositol 3,4,5-trisphosphate 3-phosphatase and dual-specificity protein phosphatase PTEN-like n=1 Tax=Oppia nitens TaxID=1686743 RepID=UPI0023DC54C4|nr:phosphatidylinositol 3,4,5-trisphosphate 3-phosphatase and dual-specificity protein phosphatase PTEN-like [Oppia nitens]
MASAIKGMVSKNKIRYRSDGFDLDLSYISRNIIAMGFPADTIERFYRNPINDVVRFFETKHKDRYRIYNLCAERQRRYDTSKFQCRVNESFTFQDHNPPPFEILKPFCEDVHKWLSQDKNNVIAIHCKAGKGRTGVMICAYLIHAGECNITDETGSTFKITGADKALEYYGRHRTHDMKGVTIPSQKRYVYYYEELVKKGLDYKATSLRLMSIDLTTIPNVNSGQFVLICEIIQLPKQKLKTFEIEVKKSLKLLNYTIPDELVFRGDIKIEFFIKRQLSKEKLFQFCFNTFFIKSSDEMTDCVIGTNHLNDIQRNTTNNHSLHTTIINGCSNGQIYSNGRRPHDRKSGKEIYLVLSKDQLDKAYKDKQNRIFSSDFKVRLTFTKPIQSYSPSSEMMRSNDTVDNDSDDNESDNETDDDEDYSDFDEDSGERSSGYPQQ